MSGQVRSKSEYDLSVALSLSRTHTHHTHNTHTHAHTFSYTWNPRWGHKLEQVQQQVSVFPEQIESSDIFPSLSVCLCLTLFLTHTLSLPGIPDEAMSANRFNNRFPFFQTRLKPLFSLSLSLSLFLTHTNIHTQLYLESQMKPWAVTSSTTGFHQIESSLISPSLFFCLSLSLSLSHTLTQFYLESQMRS